MKAPFLTLTLALIGASSLSVQALDSSGQRYTQMLSSGGPGTITNAAQDIYNTGYRDQETLDVAAQALSELYLKSPDARDYADATAWLCKALGNSGDARYKPLLDTVIAGGIHRRTRKHCEKASENLTGAAPSPFISGSVDLTKYRPGYTPPAPPPAAEPAGKPAGKKTSAAKAAPAAAVAPAPAPAAAPAPRAVDFSQVREGMSMQEVDALLGPPSNQTTYMTGKQFQPFNFGAKDIQRTNYFYKGVGHIVFSLKSAYNGVYRVLQIVPDPNETGAP